MGVCLRRRTRSPKVQLVHQADTTTAQPMAKKNSAAISATPGKRDSHGTYHLRGSGRTEEHAGRGRSNCTDGRHTGVRSFCRRRHRVPRADCTGRASRFARLLSRRLRKAWKVVRADRAGGTPSLCAASAGVSHPWFASGCIAHLQHRFGVTQRRNEIEQRASARMPRPLRISHTNPLQIRAQFFASNHSATRALDHRASFRWHGLYRVGPLPDELRLSLDLSRQLGLSATFGHI